MTKRAKKIVTDPNQLSLLDLLQQERDERLQVAAGRLNVEARLQASIRAAAKAAPKSRDTLADEMTELLGETVTVNQINNWLAESHPHRMPAATIPAFCQATGGIEPLRLLAEAAGVFTLPGRDALRAEVQKLREKEQQISRERKKRELFLREMEG